MEMIVLGRFDQISARHGEALHLRPKAANAKALTEAYNSNGKPMKTLPRGFTLEHSLLNRSYSSTTLTLNQNKTISAI